MAASASATAVPVLFDSPASSTDMISFTGEIIGMAGSTVWCILRPAINKWSHYTIPVASATAWIYSVVSRVISSRIMAEDGWCPAVGGMTDVTLYIGIEMTLRLEGRPTTRVIVAFIAPPDTRGIMGPGAAHKRGGRMTQMTIQVCRNVIIMLAYSSHTVA